MVKGKKMKTFILAAVVAAISTAASAVTRNAEVWHVETVTVAEQTYQSQRHCAMQQVPVYGTVHTQHSGNGNILAGAIIGGLIGGTSKGHDSGILPGAIIGGLLGSTQQPRASQVVTGYRMEEVCNNVSVPVSNSKEQYIVHWKWNHKRGYFYSNFTHFVGQTVQVNVD